MKKFIQFKHFIDRYARYNLILVLLLSLGLQVNAQTDVIVGAGSSSGTSSNGATGDCGPIYRSGNTSSFDYSLHNHLFDASELSAIPSGDLITKIAWFMDNAGVTTGNAQKMDIYLKNSTATSLTAGTTLATATAGATLVYSSTSQAITGTPGWVEFIFTSPFVYTGGALEVIIDWDISNVAGNPTNLGFSWKKDNYTGKVISYIGSTASTTMNTARTVRAQTKFTHMANGPCTNPPTPGTVSATNLNPCPNANFGLGITGGTSGSGQTYQWEISPDDIVWTPISGATLTTLTTSQASSNYYRCVVTCGVSVPSTSLLVSTGGSPLVGAYTINNTLPTGGTNYASFTDLATDLACLGVSGPVTVTVASGTGPYNEQVVFNEITGASSLNTVTIDGNGEKITFASANAAAPSTIELNGTDYMTFNNLIVEATGATYAFAMHGWNDANSNTFTMCQFLTGINATSSTTVPFSISGSQTSATTTGPSGSNNLIDGCDVVGGYYCLTLVGNSGSINTGNQVTGCHVRDFYFYGMYNLYQDGLLISDNDVTRPNRSTLSTFYGIYVSTGCINTLVEKNKVSNPFAQLPTSTSIAYCIYLPVDGTPGNENKVINNEVFDINSNGTIYGLYLSGADYVQAYHNTISLDYTASTAGTTYGIYNTGSVGGIDIKNNIVTITRGGTGTKYCLYYTGTLQSSDNNVLYINSAAGTNYVGYNGTAYTTLSAWQTASSKDLSSVDIDPVYNAPLTGDFTPTVSGVNAIGANVGVVDDINNNPRAVASPDPGAVEFTLAAVDVALVSMNTPNLSGCYTSAETVELLLQNGGSTPIDFSSSFATLNLNVSGPATYNISDFIFSGNIPVGGTLPITMSQTIDLTLPGTYTITGDITMSGDGFSANDTLAPITINVGVVAGTITATQTDLCVSGTPDFTLTGNYGGTIQWQESTVSSSGPWTNVGTGGTTYTPSSPITQETWVQVEATCNTNVDVTNTIHLIVNNPLLSSTTPGSRCGVGTVDLSAVAASATSNVVWYDVPTGSSPLFTGPNFTTPTISSTTTFYAAAVDGLGIVPLLDGATWNQYTTVGSFQSTAIGSASMVFDALQPITITSLDFYPAAAIGSPYTIEVRQTSASGALIASYSGVTTVTNSGTPSVAETAPVNFVIPTGTDYVIGFAVNPNTWRGNMTNFPYPYVLPGYLNIQGSSFGTSPGTTLIYQYYLYGWKILAGCESARVPVVASVTAGPTITPSSNVTICEGQSTTLDVTSTNDPNYTYTWNPGGLVGATQTVSPTSNTTYTVEAIDNTSGPNAGCANVGTVTVTVNPNPIFSATATPTTVTCGSTATLEAISNSTFVSGTGTVNNSTTGQTPYTGFYEGQRTQYLILASELLGQAISPGNITDLSFNVLSKLSGASTGNPSGAYIGYTIRMANTATSDLGAADATGTFTTVYGPTNYNTVAGINTHTFTTPFVWDGVSNIVVQVCFENDPTNALGICYSSNDGVEFTTTSGVTTRGYYADGIATCSAGGTLVTASQRPNMVLSTSSLGNYTWNPGALVGSPQVVSPATTTIYTVTATGANGCTATNAVTVTVIPCTPILNATFYIQGYYAGSNTMQSVLLNQGVSGALATEADDVTVDLMDATSPYAMAYTFSGKLMTDGTIACTYPAAAFGNSYYIRVTHRNSIETWSANPVAITGTTSYDFSTSAAQAYGGNQIDAALDGVYSIYNGDVTQDGTVDIFDFLTWDADNQAFASGYYATDFNGDGNVDIFDFLVWDPNNQNFIGLITP